MDKVGNGEPGLLALNGDRDLFEQARAALVASIQEITDERDERTELIEDAFRLRKSLNRLAKYIQDVNLYKSSNVVSFPPHSSLTQSVTKALSIAINEAKKTNEGYFPICSAIYWMDEDTPHSKHKLQLIATRNGDLKLLNCRTTVIEGETPRLDRKEWISAKTIKGLIPFLERGFDYDIFLEELLAAVS